jgi:hypothetical protein
MTKIMMLFVAATAAFAQVGTIGSGVTIVVRTNETIKTKKYDGRVYTGVVDQDVHDQNGKLAIPRGSEAELIVRRTSDKELLLDLESVIVNGRRYAVAANPADIGSAQRDGVGGNRRTGKFVGGGAVLGTISGALAGGGKGAAIGAVSGAAVGAGTQTLTRGKSVRVAAESVLTFRLERPLQVDIADNGYSRGKQHYHKDPNR